MMATSAAIGALSGVVGVYASFYLSVASGPAVVLVATLIFVVVFLAVPGRGVLGSRRRSIAASTEV
jgi:ABC-type Mn2+/Zn2+ transport system permease subunit